MKSRQFELDDAIAAHEATFDLFDLSECVEQSVLDALRDGDEAAAGHILANNMRNLIRARAHYAIED